MKWNLQTCLQFFLDAEDEIFYVDSNLDLDENIFVALVYPEIEVWVGLEKFQIDCAQENFFVEPDKYSIIEFMKKFPEMCVKIIKSHPMITEKFLQYISKSD